MMAGLASGGRHRSRRPTRRRCPAWGRLLSRRPRPGAPAPAAPPRPSGRAVALGALAVPGLLGLARCGADPASGGPDHIRIVAYYNTPADAVAIAGTSEK